VSGSLKYFALAFVYTFWFFRFHCVRTGKNPALYRTIARARPAKQYKNFQAALVSQRQPENHSGLRAGVQHQQRNQIVRKLMAVRLITKPE